MKELRANKMKRLARRVKEVFTDLFRKRQTEPGKAESGIIPFLLVHSDDDVLLSDVYKAVKKLTPYKVSKKDIVKAAKKYFDSEVSFQQVNGVYEEVLLIVSFSSLINEIK